jgi:hypothetical protein
MSDLKGVGGSSAAHFYGSHSSQDRVTTVKVGENTLADVARRLGNGITEEALRKENPHIGKSVLPGQDIRLPARDEVKSSKPKKEETVSEPKNEEPRKAESNKTPPKKDGIKYPKVGGYEVKPTYVPGTDDTHDRGGTSSNRKDEQSRLDRSRPRDERDLDPKVIEAEKKKKIEESAKQVDKGRIDPAQVEREKQRIREMSEKLRK